MGGWGNAVFKTHHSRHRADLSDAGDQRHQPQEQERGTQRRGISSATGGAWMLGQA